MDGTKPTLHDIIPNSVSSGVIHKYERRLMIPNPREKFFFRKKIK